MKRLSRRPFVLALFLVAAHAALHSRIASAQQGDDGSRPVRAVQGLVTGTVVDSLTGKPIAGAAVHILGTKRTLRTDGSGKFSVELPEGTVKLRITADGHDAREISVDIASGVTANGDVALARETSILDVFEVLAELIRGSESAQVQERKEAAAVAENIGAESIAQSPDSDAAEVVQRLSGVTVKDDKFVFVRGLGERYSSALLNGSRLPSTNPDKRVVALDLFPSTFIESLSITKSYTPDLPGDFSGGLVDIRLKEFPEELTGGLGISTGGNTETTFQSFDTYKGSSADYFGFGAKYRERPGAIPDDILDPSTPETTARMRKLSNAFRNIWDPYSTTAAPNLSMNGSVGNSYGPFGFNLGASYGNSYSVRRNELRRSFYNRSFFETGDFQGAEIKYDRSKFETQLGGLLTAGYKFRDDDRILLRSFVNRGTSDEVLVGQGINDNRDEFTVFPRRLQYREEQLGFGQLSGSHDVVGNRFEWRTAGAETRRNDPDTRLVRQQTFTGTPDAPRSLDVGPNSPLRSFVDLHEVMSDTAADMTVPFLTRLPFTDVWRGLDGKWKSGVAYTYRDRSMDFRRFAYQSGVSAGELTGDIEGILGNDDNIGIGRPLVFAETTRTLDSFDADQEIIAGYSMLDVPIIADKLRVIGGVRLEHSDIRTHFLLGEDLPGTTSISGLDVLPGVNLVWDAVEDMKVRYGFSETVSRPEFRDLTPTEFPVPDGERAVEGNPALSAASITSHDLRWEWYYSDLELFSVGGFYKDMNGIIEQVTLSRTSATVDSFRNADAYVYGLEFEARKNLGMFADLLPTRAWALPLNTFFSNSLFQTNVSWIQSSSDISKLSGEACRQEPVPRECTETQTSEKRALQGQPEFTVNASLEYRTEDWGTYRVLYATVGREIAAAGVDGLPDIYKERRDQLDVVWTGQVSVFDTPLEAKAAIENLIDDRYLQTQGGEATERYKVGVRFSLGVSYKF